MFGSYICCAISQIASVIIDSSQFFGTSYTPSINPRKTWCLFRPAVNPCSALLGRGDSLSVYPLTTCPVHPPVIILSFTSIARTVQEEFSNRQKRLYVSIDIDKTQPHSAQVMKCIIDTKLISIGSIYNFGDNAAEGERECKRPAAAGPESAWGTSLNQRSKCSFPQWNEGTVPKQFIQLCDGQC